MRTQNPQIVLLSLAILLTLAIGCSRLNQDQANTTQQQPAANLPNPDKSPSFVGYIRDEANVIDSKSEAEIEAALRKLEERAKIKFIVATLKSTGGLEIRDYTSDLLSKMDVSAEKGVILLLTAIDDRGWYIQTAPGTDTDLTNEDLKEVGETLVPDFKAKRYADGVKKCIRLMIAKLSKSVKFAPIELK